MAYQYDAEERAYVNETTKWITTIYFYNGMWKVSLYSKARQASAQFFDYEKDEYNTVAEAKKFAARMRKEIGA
jgi:hypothetical protein